MSKVYDPDRIARLAQISTKFHAHAAVGDEIHLGIEGDEAMPAKYRGGSRPTGTIVKIKNEGTENSTLRVQMEGSGRVLDLHPFTVAGDRVWEFSDRSWEKVLARSNPAAAEGKYRGSSNEGSDDIAAMRQQMSEMAQRFDREMAEAKNFNNALVESIAQITGEIEAVNPQAKFSKVFREEYRGMKRTKEPSPFDSDFESGDDM